MPKTPTQMGDRQFRLAFALICVLLVVLWIGGGASRADVPGQVLVRAACWTILIVFILVGKPPSWKQAPAVWRLFLAIAALPLVQLIPLPPSIWTALPGRELLEAAARVGGHEQPWRPLSISPPATLNALSSLIVPAVTLLLAVSIRIRSHWRVAMVLLALITASTLLGLLQVSGSDFDHPLINDVPTSVSASFANRNHFALFAAIGCVLAPAWAFREEGRAGWKGPIAIGLILLFALIILATGSRTGIVVGMLGIALGLVNVRRQVRVSLRRLPRPAAIGASIVGVAALAGGVAISVFSGRALSIDRVLSLDFSEDLRRQALPTVWEITTYYFPVGTGYGTFDPVYRIHEPDKLLSLSYFNHAHNDFLEIVLDGGLAGLLLLVATVAWWLWRSVRVWRFPTSHPLLSRMGSSILLLVLVASVTDYPARTPMIMAMVAIAAVWLNGFNGDREHSQR